MHLGCGSSRIDVVFDTYDDNSIKNAERVKRGSNSGVVFSNIAGGHRIKQWRRLLSSSKSKTNLINYLIADWKRPQLRAKLVGNKELYVTCEDKCYRLTYDNSAEVLDLCTKQEEADTRMFLHAQHAASGSKSIIIASEDTDILIIALALSSNLQSNVFMKCGTKNRERFIDGCE